MVTVPSFLLRRLYVHGSLRNTDRGMQFQLMNKLGAGYARRLFPLVVDGQDVPMDRCTFLMNGTQVPFDAVSDRTPFTLDLNKTTTINVAQVVLTNQAHTIEMSFEVPGLGVLQFDFTDVPSDG